MIGERRCARLVILDADNRLLLFRYHDEHKAPFWGTAGGELLPGESYRDAARRELLEETGFDAPIGRMLRAREATFAVARSTPSRWLERYYLVRYTGGADLSRDGWTDEEQATIRAWRWWNVSEMRSAIEVDFKPDWLPELLAECAAGGDRRNIAPEPG